MRIWVAKDWYGTLVFTTQPKLLPSYGSNKKTEWYGHREHFLERFLTKEIRDKVKMNKCIECELEVNIKAMKGGGK